MTLRSLCALVLLATTGSVQSADFDPGKFLAEKCSRCHDDRVYTRPDRRVQSLQALDAQVRRCDAMNQTGLFDSEITTLIDHLNGQYYHF